MPGKLSRRNFIQTSTAAGVVGLATLNSTQAAGINYGSPNEQPVVGYIGTGIRFHSALANGGTKYGPCAGIADVDMIQRGRALQRIMDRHRESNRPLAIANHEDYRHVLDNKDINIVLIASPDHWHTKHVVEAMQAGKDVYCEKPLTLTIGEGQIIEKVMKETGRIMQIGTQQRTEYNQMFAKAAAMVRDNRVGDLKTVTVAIGGSRNCDPLPVVDVPKELNWDLWQGPAPEQKYRSGSEIVDNKGWGAGHPFSRTHRYYRWFYEYSGGKLTDWGAHHVDIAMLALNKLNDDIGAIDIEPEIVEHPVPFDEKGMPTQDDRFNCATKFKVKLTFADGIVMYVRHSADDKGFTNGIMFEGSKGRFLVNRGKLVGKPVEELKSNPLPEDALEKMYGAPIPKSHMDNFMECCNTRRQPISDLYSHNRMLNVCHAINIAMRLNRKLTYDPRKQNFGDDAVANSFITREARSGFETKV